MIDAGSVFRALRDGHITRAEAQRRLSGQPGAPTTSWTFRHDEPFLAAHTVFGRQVLLGTTHVSLALAVAADAAPGAPVQLRNIAFHAPVVLGPGEQVEVEVQTAADGSRTRFATVARRPGHDDVVAVSGELRPGAGAEPAAPLDLEALRTAAGASRAADVLAELPLLAREPALAVVERVWTAAASSLGQLRLTPAARAAGPALRVPPALLDGAFVVGAAGLEPADCQPASDGLWVPLGIRAVHGRPELPDACWCRARAARVREDSLAMDLELCDAEGHVLLAVEGFALRFARPDAFLPAAATQEPADDDVRRYLEGKISAALPDGGPLQPDMNFMELGLDSAALIALARELEAELGIELYPTLFFEHQNLDELSAAFAEHADAVARHRPSRARPAAPRRRVAARADGDEPVLEQTGKEIAIVGMAGRFAGSPTLDDFWHHVREGSDLISEVPADRWDWRAWFDEDRKAAHKTYARWGSFIEVDRFDPSFFGISPREAIWLDPQLRLLLEVVHAAGEDAGAARTLPGSRTGLFLGVSFLEYWDEIVRAHVPISDYQAVTASPAALTGRLSYLFDLQGPSVPVDTACASSLTALHLACRSLRGGECETAVVAAANLLLSPLHYVYTAKAGALSPTGRCHTFAAQADGYVPGEGVAALLLKPLPAALRDGDRVHAVVKGTAVNHVGRANNPTAPRPELQTRVIVDAWDDAGIDPSSLGYIEAHGTGTLLGDPVEVSALNAAFAARATRECSCAVASVKAHIGHLEAAAGIAGVVRTILSMQHGEIAPMPGLRELNPYLDLDGSPLRIATTSKAWPAAAATPRRAGVSSFGMSGNNAHVVLEEAPAPDPCAAGSGCGPQVLLLSARDEARLHEHAGRLAEHLERTQPQLLDVVHTLGRRAPLAERAALVAGDLRETIALLRRLADPQTPDRVLPAAASSGAPDLAEVAARWSAGDDVEPPAGGRLVSLPTYPFARERYWLPDEWRDDRGREARRPHPLLAENVSTLGRQCFRVALGPRDALLRDHVVAGRPTFPGTGHLELARAAGTLSADGRRVTGLRDVVWRRPLVVEGACEVAVELSRHGDGLAFAVVDASALDDRQRPFSQGRITLADASAPSPPPPARDVSAIRARCPERVGGEALYADFAAAGLDYGPSFRAVRELWTGEHEVLAHLALAPALRPQAATFVLHPALVDAALQSLAGLTAADRGRHAPLYVPFSVGAVQIHDMPPPDCLAHATRSQAGEHEPPSFDIELLTTDGTVLVSVRALTLRAVQAQQARPSSAAAQPPSGSQLLLFEEVWQATPAPAAVDAPGGRMVVLDDSGAIADALVHQGFDVLRVRSDEDCEDPAAGDVVVSPAHAEDVERAWEVLTRDGLGVDAVVHAWSWTPQLAEQAARGAGWLPSLLGLTRALQREDAPPPLLVAVPDPPEGARPEDVAVGAFARTARAELPRLDIRALWLPAGAAPDALAAHIRSELRADHDPEVRYRHGTREVLGYRERSPLPVPAGARLETGGTWLLTGGLGRLGRRVAEHLVKRGVRSLALAGRGMPDADGRAWLATLEAAGAQVVHLPADLADHESVLALVGAVRERLAPLCGVVHLAGVVHDAYVRAKTVEQAADVLGAKAWGARWLDAATRSDPLVCFACFSSLAGALGNPGQADYAYANRFLDQLVQQRARSAAPGRSIALAWPWWSDGGMRLDAATERLMRTGGMHGLGLDEGLAMLDDALLAGAGRLLVVKGDPDRMRAWMAAGGAPPAATAGQARDPASPSDAGGPAADALRPVLADAIGRVLSLRPEDADAAADLGELGFDSVTFTELANVLNEQLELELMPAVFFEHPSIASLAEHVAKLLAGKHADELQPAAAPQPALAPESRQPALAPDPRQPALAPDPPPQPALAPDPPPQPAPAPAQRPARAAAPQEELVAIVGMSGRFPGAADPEELWAHLVARRDLIDEVPRERWDWREWTGGEDGGRTAARWGGFVADVDAFDCAFFGIAPSEAALMDPQQRLFLEAAWHALEDAGHRPSELAGSATGVFVGVGGRDYAELLGARNDEIEAVAATGTAHSLLANRVSFLLDLHGPSEPVDTACSASLVALHRAVVSVRRRESSWAIAGGVNLVLTPTGSIAFGKAGMLAPDGRCKTFDARADGYVRGEGVGAVVLRPLADALADGDNVYAVIRATAVNHGGRATALTAPNPIAQSELLVRAYREAGVDPTTVGFIEAHGTGTSLGDPIEVNALKRAFAELGARRDGVPPHCGLGSIKANIGHLESAAGIAGVIKVLLALRHRRIPGLAHFEELNPQIVLAGSPLRIAVETEPWREPCDADGQLAPRRAGVSSFGYGGANAHVVLEQAPVAAPRAPDGEPQIVPISARTPERLRAAALALLRHLEPPGQTRDRPSLHKLRQLAAELLDVAPAELDVDEPFAELGLDQVGRAELARHAVDDLRMETAPATLLAADSLAELAAILDDGDAEAPPPGPDAPELGDLAYTLQVGREQMAERLVVVVATIEDLRAALSAHRDGEDVAGLYRGRAGDAGAAALLLDGPEGASYVQTLVAGRNLTKLGRLWAAGADVPWELLHDRRRRRVSLPGYAFERRRLWAGASPRPAAPADGASAIASDSPAHAPPQHAPPRRASATGGVLEELTAAFAEVLGWDESELDPRATFEELGMSSVLIRRLSGRLEARFGNVPHTTFFACRTLSGLAERLAASESTRPTPPAADDSRPRLPVDRGAASGAIAIIGMAGRYPGAGDLDELWGNLCAGRDCVGELPADRPGWARFEAMARERLGQRAPRWGGFLDCVDEFDPLFFGISPLEARFLDPQERLFIETVWACLEDAAYTPERLADPMLGNRRAAVGVFAGMTYNTYPLFAAGAFERGEWLPVNTQTFATANRVSYLLNLGGPSLTVDTACSSSLYAIHLACESLRRGECRLAVAGGVNLSLHPAKYVTLSEAGFTSSDGRCRAFGEGGDGYVPAEGVGAVLLKPLAQALADGDRIDAVIRGSAVNHDGRTFGFSVPNPVAQTELITRALAEADVPAESITYVEAHGTGTSLGDPIEVQALTDAFRSGSSEPGRCALGSIKSNIGHAEAAAGIAQVAKVVLQLRHRKLVPSLTHSAITNPQIDFDATPFSVQVDLAPWQAPGGGSPRRAGISSFGAGGVNVHVILEEAPARIERRSTEPDGPALVLLSARRQDALRSVAARLRSHLLALPQLAQDRTTLRDLARTLQLGREAMEHRAAFAAGDRDGLLALLDAVAAARPAPGLATGQVERPTAPPPGRLLELARTGGWDTVAEEWAAGTAWAWDELYDGEQRAFLSLPTYPFARERYWIVDDDPQPAVARDVRGGAPVHDSVVATLASAPESERRELLAEHVRAAVGSLLELPASVSADGGRGFFDLGMDSVLATRLVNGLSRDLGLELPAGAIFDHASVDALTTFLLSELSHDAGAGPSGAGAPSAPQPGTTETIRFNVGWEPTTSVRGAPLEGDVVVFEGEPPLADALREARRAAGIPGRVLAVVAGGAFARPDEDRFELRPDAADDHAELVDALRDGERLPVAFVDARLTGDGGAWADVERDLRPAWLLTQALLRVGAARPIRLLHLHLCEESGSAPLGEAFGGFARSVEQEAPRVAWTAVGVARGGADQLRALVGACQAELVDAGAAEPEVLHAGGERRVRRLRELVAAQPPGEHDVVAHGVHLITGGAGGLGLVVAGHLARRGAEQLVLVGRSPLDDRRREALARVEALGAGATYLHCDVARASDVRRVVAQVRERHGRLDGVVHAAGTLRDALVRTKPFDDTRQVIATKVAGAVHLDAATADDELRFFVLFSSLAAAGGNAGQADYAYANRFLSAFARRRDARRPGRTVAILWPPWREGGMRLDQEAEAIMRERAGLVSLDTADGLTMLDLALAGGGPEVGVVRADRDRLRSVLDVLPARPQTGPPRPVAEELSAVLEELGV